MAATTVKTPEHASNVYLFKNGYGMIVKIFEFPPNKDNTNSSIELLNPPSSPVHGAFWIQSVSNKTSISSIRTKKTRQIVAKECSTIEELLEANIGQDIQLLVEKKASKDPEWISGKIKSIKRTQVIACDDEKKEEDVAQPIVGHNAHPMTVLTASMFPSTVPTPPRAPSIESGNLILFETNDNWLTALPLSSVQSIRGATLKNTYEHKVFKNCLSVSYKNESDSNDRGLMKYLTFGITWAPSYSLVLLTSNDPTVKKLRLSAKAVILNDIENMTVDNLYCIVGFPNVSKFASVIDPIISGADVRTFLNELKQSETGTSRGYPNNNPSVFSNSIMTQQIQQIAPYTMNYAPDDTQNDTNVDDLHLYEFKNISLNKKERLMLPMFDVEIPYKDVYHCKIDTSQTSPLHSGYSENKQYEEVWHSVEFENVSDFVWTTAPIVITKGQLEQQFIGQDTLTYTLKGSPTFVNLTKALDIRVQLDEKVIQTNPRKIILFRVNYQVDEIEGKIVIMNYKSERVVVVINAALMGKTNNYSIEPKHDLVKVNENVANQKHDVRWEVTLNPRQTMEIKYYRQYNKRV